MTVTVNIKPTTLQGVAPFPVFLDASDSVSTNTKNVFHEVGYKWTYGNGETSLGPLGACVFDSAGSYNIYLETLDSCRSGSYPAVLEGLTATVTSEDDEFPDSASTVCVSAAGMFEEAPEECIQVTSSDFDSVISTYAESNRRILFSRGETFTSSSGCMIDQNLSNFRIGAFGTAGTADARGIYNNDPIISFTCDSSKTCLEFNRDSSNVVIQHLRFQTTVSPAGIAIAANRYSYRFLIYRCSFSGFGFTISFGPDIINYNSSAMHQQFFVANCYFPSIQRYGAYIGAENSAWINNYTSTPTGPSYEHQLRLPHAVGYLVRHNTFESANPGKECIKMHAQAWTSTSPYYSERNVICHNTASIDGDSNWGFAILPQDTLHDERLRIILVEANTFFLKSKSCQAIRTSANEITIRNNSFILENANSGAWPNAIMYGRWKMEPVAKSLWVYRNSVYVKTTTTTTNAFEFVWAPSESKELFIADNLLYSGSSTPLTLTAGGGVWALNKNNKIETTDPYTEGDADDLTPTRTIVGTSTVPVYYDQNLTYFETPDVGAIKKT